MRKSIEPAMRSLLIIFTTPWFLFFVIPGLSSREDLYRYPKKLNSVAICVLLGVAGMLPRSDVLGPNLIRLPPAAAARGEIALTFDDGPDRTTTSTKVEMHRFGIMRIQNYLAVARLIYETLIAPCRDR